MKQKRNINYSIHKKKGTRRKRILTAGIILSLALILCICFLIVLPSYHEKESAVSATNTFQITDIPEYTGSPYIEIDNNRPSFSDKDLTGEPFEHYSDLDVNWVGAELLLPMWALKLCRKKSVDRLGKFILPAGR